MSFTRFSRFFLQGILCLAAFAGDAGAQSIAVLTGAQGTSTSIPVFSAYPLAPVATIDGIPAGGSLLLPKPDGSKFYLVTASPGITVLDRDLRNPVQILTFLKAAPDKVALSPDGRRLSVIAANLVYLVDTATDSVAGTALNVSGTPVDVAFAQDSQNAFILSNSGLKAYVTPVDLTTNTLANTGFATLPVSANATDMAAAPNGFIYVSAPNALFEINPRTMLVTPGFMSASAATIPVNGAPGKVQFTSDSQTAIALNRTPASGAAIIFNLPGQTATLSSGADFNTTLDQLVVASDNRIFARSTQNTLYELSLYGGLRPSPVMSILPPGAQILSILSSSEAQAKALFVTAVVGGASTLYRVDLLTNSVGSQVPLSSQTGLMLALAGTNPGSGGVAVQGLGTYQTLYSGGGSALVARVLDANGLPVFNTTVTFTVLCGGVTLSSTTATTNSAGFAQVNATAGANSGAFEVQATVPGGAGGGVTYSLNVFGGATGTAGCLDGNADGLFIASGNGQIVSEQHVAPQMLMVVAKDANGNPAPQREVVFSIVQGLGTILCPGVGDQAQFPYVPSGACQRTPYDALSIITDPAGRAAVKYLATSIDGGKSFVQTVVNATSTTGSVNFFVTTVLVARSGGSLASLPFADFLTPQPGTVPGFTGIRVVTGSIQQTVKGGIQVRVVPVDGLEAGLPIPNVAVNVSGQGDPQTTPSASCAGGSVLTDATGLAICDVVLGPVAGSGLLNVDIGGAVQTPLFGVVVTPGVPFKINLLQGDNQSGAPGQPLTLRARVLDPAGNPAPNVPVSWAVVQGSGTLSAASLQSDPFLGNARSTLTLGSSPGKVLVRLTAGSGDTAVTATFNVTVNLPVNIGAVSLLSGAGQIAFAGQPFGAPLVVRVTGQNGQPVPGATVAFAVTGGTATLGSTMVITDPQGNAGATVTAGITAGTILITASSGGKFAQATLTTRGAGVSIGSGSFRNAASSAPGLSPCGIGMVSAAGLAPGIQGTVTRNAADGSMPLNLAGVSLTVNGIPAPIVSVSNTPQGGEAVAFQTPCEVTPGPATVVITVNGDNATVPSVPVTKYQPGIFETVIDGRKYAVVTHLSGSTVTPDNPARRGERLKMFVTGLGPGLPPIGTNRPGTGGQPSDAILTAGVNNAAVAMVGSEYVPGLVGVYSVTFEVPVDTAPGPYQNLALIVADPNDPARTPIYAPGTFIPIGE